MIPEEFLQYRQRLIARANGAPRGQRRKRQKRLERFVADLLRLDLAYRGDPARQGERVAAE